MSVSKSTSSDVRSGRSGCSVGAMERRSLMEILWSQKCHSSEMTSRATSLPALWPIIWRRKTPSCLEINHHKFFMYFSQLNEIKLFLAISGSTYTWGRSRWIRELNVATPFFAHEKRPLRSEDVFRCTLRGLLTSQIEWSTWGGWRRSRWERRSSSTRGRRTCVPGTGCEWANTAQCTYKTCFSSKIF